MSRITCRLFVSLAMVGSAGNYVWAQQSSATVVNNDDISGVVTSTKGPQAVVWVIAETSDLPAKFVRIVVTDDRGRYLLPELPKARYKVWVRGYGLVDSTPLDSRPGVRLNLRAIVAPTRQAAARYYPSNYWYSLLKVPDASQFPGKGSQGNGNQRNSIHKAIGLPLRKHA